MKTSRYHMFAAATVLLASTAAFAQGPASPYAGEQARAIKSLSDRDVAGLVDGQGAGFAKAAELNGYPGPAHTLELKDRLALSAQQVAASEQLMGEHKRRARELGALLVEAERRLDALFAERRAEPAAVDAAARDIGLLQARLRAEHLNTHLAQTALLSSHQVRNYNQLRGYETASPSPEPARDSAQRHHH